MRWNWKKAAALVLMLVLVLAALTACGGDKTAVNNAKLAWNALNRTDVPDSVSYMHYTSADSLKTSVATPDATVALVPSSGYAYFFAPSGSGEKPFEGLSLVFVSTDGQLVTVLSYDDLYDVYADADDGTYLDAANYVASLYVDTLNSAVTDAKDEKVGTWYTFTKDQLTKMAKQ